jgi:FkbM family methyltransferase
MHSGQNGWYVQNAIVLNASAAIQLPIQKAGQMDLGFSRKADFTKWVVSAGLLTESFVLIDVGVQGGENIRWRPLGDHLVVHGFDPIEEAIEILIQGNRGRSNRHYHCMALGDADGERAFYFNSANPTASSMYRQGTGRFEVETAEQVRIVRMRRLDSLLAQDVVPKADFIKIDVEGFEKEVLLGAREVLCASVLGLHTETNFAVSPAYPKSHFGTLVELALENHLLVFDVAFNRIPRASYQRALIQKGLEPISEQDILGRPATVDVLFSRDLIDEVDHPGNYQSPCRPFTVNELIKSMVIFELHALNDVALDTAERFAERLGAHLDVDRAVHLLADPDCMTNYYRKQMSALEQQMRAQRRAFEEQMRAQRHAFELSTSWRITAPLRWAKTLVFGEPANSRKSVDN